MKHPVHAAAVAAVLFGVSGAARAQEMGNPVSLRDISGKPTGTTTSPVIVTVTNPSTGGGSSGGPATQSTGAGATAPWSMEITNGSAFNSATAPLYSSDVVTSLPSITVGSSALPAGAASAATQSSQLTAEQAIQAAVAATLKTQQQTGGTTTELTASTSVATTSTTVIPTGTGIRYRAIIYNTSATAGNIEWCRSDGGTATVGTGIPLAPNYGGYEWDYPNVGATAITCIMATAATPAAGEYVQ